MKRLFLPLFAGMIGALLLSAIIIYYLISNPVFRPNDAEIKQILSATLTDLESQLKQIDEQEWDYLVEEYEFIPGMRGVLFELIQDRETTTDYEYLETGEVEFDRYDGNLFAMRKFIGNSETVLEVSFDAQEISYQGYNLLLIVSLCLFVIALISWLVLWPIIKRLQAVELQAQQMSAGNWNFRSRTEDQRKDAIGNLSLSINQMATHIQQLIADKDLLLSEQEAIMHAVAHEFRGPMARMRFALEMGEDHLDDNDKTELHHEISTGLDDLNQLVAEVLRYARLQQPDKGESETERVDVCEIIEDIHSSLKNLHSDKHFIDDYKQAAPLVAQINKQEFDRALSNMIINAIKYGHKLVRINAQRQQDQFIIGVEDDGIGIPEHLRDRIFEPFTRLDPSRNRETGGTGLGLAIVKRICEKNNASIKVTISDLGGAKFVLHWPLR